MPLTVSGGWRPGRQLRPGALIDAAVVRQLQKGQRAVRVHLIGEAAKMRYRLGAPSSGVVVHLVGGGRMHLRLAGNDHAGAAAGAVGEVAAEAFPAIAGFAEHRGGFGEHGEVSAADDAVARRQRTDAQRSEEVLERHRRRDG